MATTLQPDVILGFTPSLYLAFGIYKQLHRSPRDDRASPYAAPDDDHIASACARYRAHAAEGGVSKPSRVALFRRNVQRWLADPHGGPALTMLLWRRDAARNPYTWARQVECKREMVNTLISLKKHSQALEGYLGDITPDGVYSQLRCDAPFCNAVDSATLHPKQTVSLGGGGTHTTISRIQALVSWFKHGYMKWIDPIPCPQCSGPTDGEGSTAPTASELADGGNRVELHRCRDPACGGSRRFVRYTKVSKLLRTREGRCGEFAHLFYAIIRVLIHLKVKGWEQVEARYVWNKEDHVWVEVWSVEERRWVHVDPCEAAVDSPRLYADGWGKKMSICLAIGHCGAEDVTETYVSDMPACADRRAATGWRGRDLALAMLQMTIDIRLPMLDKERLRMGAMDRDNAAYTANPHRGLGAPRAEQLEGRTSGTEEWRVTRGENGDASKD